MRRITTIADLRAALRSERAAGRRIGLAPTLGGLHDGHLANVRLAARHADTVVVSVFLNPTQFDRPDDLASYPADLDADERLLAALGDDAPKFVFAPSVAEMYPRPPNTTVHVDGVTDRLEGAARPGHFDGVATVVTKLLNIVTPDVLVLGRKDAQQNVVIRQLVTDLDLPVEIVLGPTVREPDGLAWSSRNTRLDAQARATATALPMSLRAVVLVARQQRSTAAGVDPAIVRAAALARLEQPGVEVDYVEVVDPETLAPVTDLVGPSNSVLVLVAATVGGVRLIDNVELGDPSDEERLLDATRRVQGEAAHHGGPEHA